MCQVHAKFLVFLNHIQEESTLFCFQVVFNHMMSNYLRCKPLINVNCWK